MKAAIKGKPLTAIAAFTEVPGVQILVSTPVGAEALAAVLENDRVHGMMAAGLLGARLVETGRAFVLVDLRSRAAAERLFGGPYLKSGLLTRPEVCAERPEACVKLARALVKATKWLSARGSAEVAPSLPRTLVQDPRLYTAALEIGGSVAVLPPAGTVTPPTTRLLRRLGSEVHILPYETHDHLRDLVTRCRRMGVKALVGGESVGRWPTRRGSRPSLSRTGRTRRRACSARRSCGRRRRRRPGMTRDRRVHASGGQRGRARARPGRAPRALGARCGVHHRADRCADQEPALATGETYATNYTLADVAARVDPRDFFRIHRNVIVNLNHVTELERHGVSQFRVAIAGPRPSFRVLPGPLPLLATAARLSAPVPRLLGRGFRLIDGIFRSGPRRPPAARRST